MFTLELSQQTLMTIMNALNNHIFREAAPAIAEIQMQVNKQMPQQGNGHAAASEQIAP